MKTISIGPDCSTATGIATFIRDRVEELKAAAKGSYEDEPAIKELLAVGHAIEIDIDKMIDHMYAENQERARQQTIQLDEVGLTAEQVKERYEF